jgi:hypothetical protein
LRRENACSCVRHDTDLEDVDVLGLVPELIDGVVVGEAAAVVGEVEGTPTGGAGAALVDGPADSVVPIAGGPGRPPSWRRGWPARHHRR